MKRFGNKLKLPARVKVVLPAPLLRTPNAGSHHVVTSIVIEQHPKPPTTKHGWLVSNAGNQVRFLPFFLVFCLNCIPFTFLSVVFCCFFCFSVSSFLYCSFHVGSSHSACHQTMSAVLPLSSPGSTKQRIIHLLWLTNLLTPGRDHIVSHLPFKPTCGGRLPLLAMKQHVVKKVKHKAPDWEIL